MCSNELWKLHDEPCISVAKVKRLQSAVHFQIMDGKPVISGSLSP
jgi:hypothetical protein